MGKSIAYILIPQTLSPLNTSRTLAKTQKPSIKLCLPSQDSTDPTPLEERLLATVPGPVYTCICTRNLQPHTPNMQQRDRFNPIHFQGARFTFWLEGSEFECCPLPQRVRNLHGTNSPAVYPAGTPQPTLKRSVERQGRRIAQISRPIQKYRNCSVFS